MSAAYLLVIGEREALAWVLREARMAFPPARRAEVDRLAVGDRLYVLTTRGCFHNPGRDATRVIGTAVVASPVVAVANPLVIAGRSFTRACDLELGTLAGYLDGVPLAPLVDSLSALAGAPAWGMRLRRPLVALGAADVRLLDARLAPIARPAAEVVPEYLRAIKPVAPQRAGATVGD